MPIQTCWSFRTQRGISICLDIAASGSLTVQDFVTDGTNTIYSQKRALHVLNQTDNHWNPNQGIVVSGDLIMNGGAIIASSHINFFAGGTFTVDGESVLALGDAISGSSNLFRFSNSAAAVSINGLISQGGANAFESAVFSRLDGYAPQFMGAGIMAVGDVDLVGYNPQNCDMDIEFGNVNNNGSRYTIHGYADKAVTASIHSAYTTAPDAWAKVMKELNLTLLDEANAPIPDGVCYFKDTDHGARYNKVQDLTGDIIYTGTSDASGQMQHDILLANVQHGVSDVLPLYSDPRPVDYRTKNNSHDYKMDVAVCSYNHLPRIASDVDLTGLDRSVDLSMILSADASITEADPDVVAGYGEIPTAAEIYDAGKLWLVNNYEGQSATLVTKEGDSKVVMASDVVVDPSDSIISDVLWTQLDNLPFEDVYFNTSQILSDGKIWMTGGIADTTDNLQFLGTYDSAAGSVSWVQLDNLPVEDVSYNTSQILSDGKIWMTGGYADTTDNLQFLGTYDSAAGSVSWVQLDNLPVEEVSYNTSQVLADGKIWMTGGIADTTDNLQFLGTYDSAAGSVSWVQLDNLPVEDVYFNTSQILSDGKIWMTGGIADTTDNLQFLGTYDSAAGSVSWVQLDNLPVEDVYFNTSQILSDGKIWMTGGIADTTDNLQFLGTYDSAAGSVSWVQLDNLPVEEVSYNTSQVLADGKIWMTGGIADTTDNLQFLGIYLSDSYLATIETVVEADTGDGDVQDITWVQLDNLPVEGVQYNTSQILSDGKIWMTGGESNRNDQWLGSYDSAAGTMTWAQINYVHNSSEVFHGNTSLILPDGKLWATGGYAGNPDGYRQYLGVYDSAAATVTWVQLSDLPTRVLGNTSLLLPDGKLWMTGGDGDGDEGNLQFLGTYDSAAGTVTWVRLSDLPAGLVVNNASLLLPDGKIWMNAGVLGSDADESQKQFLGTYDSAAGTVTWVQLADFPYSNFAGNVAAVLADGTLWTTGGRAGDLDNLQFFGTYDSAAGTITWVEDALPVSHPVVNNTMQVLPDGKIWMTGGESRFLEGADSSQAGYYNNLQFLGTVGAQGIVTTYYQTVPFPFNGFHYEKQLDRIQIRASDLEADVRLTGGSVLTLQNGATMSGTLQDANGDSLVSITTPADYGYLVRIYDSQDAAQNETSSGLLSTGTEFRYDAADYGGMTVYVRMQTAEGLYAIAPYTVETDVGVYEAYLLTSSTESDLDSLSEDVAAIQTTLDALMIKTRNIEASTL